MMVADSNTGKTTFEYDMVYESAQYGKFLGIEPSMRIKTIMLDYESGPSLIKSKWDRLCNNDESIQLDEEDWRRGLGIRDDTLLVFDADSQSLLRKNKKRTFFPDIQDWVTKAINTHNANLLIIDSLRWAFNMKDENDNAEGQEQMTMLSDMAKNLNIAILLAHHTTKANAPGIRKGAGALSRIGAVDIAFNLSNYRHKRGIDEDGYDKIIPAVEIEMVKSRFDGDLFNWYLEKYDGRFKIIPQEEIPLDNPAYEKGAISQAIKIIKEYLYIKGKQDAESILHYCEFNGFSRRTIFRTLKKMREMGIIVQEYPRYGDYYLAEVKDI